MMKRSNLTAILVITLLGGAAGAAQAGWEEGVAALKAKNYTEAARHFQQVTTEHPEWPDGYFMLGQSLLKLNKDQEALNALREAYNLNPNEVKYQYQLGRTYAQVKRYREAAELLGKVDESKLSAEQRQDYQQTYAAALSKSGQGGQALDALGKAAKGSPNDAGAQYNYGAALYNAGRVSESIAYLEKAATLDGDDPAKLKAYVDALQRRGRETQGSAKAATYDKAVVAARKLVAKKPTYDNYLLLGETQLGAGKYTEAVESFNQATQRNGSSWLAHYYTGQAYTAAKSYSEAEQALKKALSSKPSTSDQNRVWKQLGFVYEKLKKYDDAAKAYETAGDPAGAQRVRENEQIAKHNKEAEAEQEAFQKLQEKERELQEQLKALGDEPPRW